MAKEQKFPPHGLVMYNSRGEYMYCYNESDLVRAKENGFTSVKYVRSFWPKTVFNKATGESKPVGKLALSNEQNEKLLADLGPDWTTEHVPVPEKVVETKAAQGAVTADLLGVLAQMLVEQKAISDRIGSIETALIELGDSQAELQKRVDALTADKSAKKSADKPAEATKA